MAPRAWMHLGSDILLSHLPSRAPVSSSSLIPQPPSLAAPLTLVGVPVSGVMSILCPGPSVAGHKLSPCREPGITWAPTLVDTCGVHPTQHQHPHNS